jgi:hypothetical protein
MRNNPAASTAIRSLLILFLVIAEFSPKLYAQMDSARTGAGEILKSDGSTIFSDAKNIIISPVHWDGKEWVTAGAIVGGTLLLMTTDQSTRDLAQRNQSDFGDHFFHLAGEYGVATYGFSAAGGLYIGGLAFNSSEVRETGLDLIEALSFAGAATTIGKTIFGRSRPFLEDGPHKFQPFQTKNEYLSLPSGDATVAFAVSSTLSERFNNTYATIGLYGLATMTAFSRVYHDQHWLSDTFAGAAIGTFMGVTVAHMHDHKDQQSLHIYPTPNGLQAVFIF